MNTYTKKCEICAQEFTTFNSAKKRCSPNCQKIAHRNYFRAYIYKRREDIKPTFICQRCKREFKSGRKNQRLCLECKAIDYRACLTEGTLEPLKKWYEMKVE